MIRRGAIATIGLVSLSACDGIQSMNGGDGFHGRQFNDLFTLFMVVTSLSYVLVLLFLGWALLRRRGERHDRMSEAERRKARDPGLTRGLVGWIGFIVVGLTLLTIASYFADRGSAIAAEREAPLQIAITANQWWWEVEYQDRLPSNIFRTANELHLPAGVPVEITLRSNDVIHSFWVPNLAGKQDLIPGRTTNVRLIARESGAYRGQCAEFCGIQHAHMALDVTVEPPEAFARWRATQQAPASPPATPAAQAGYGLFMTRQCSICHSIAGTPARGTIGPDLTHFASRRSIGAGTYPMTRGHLYGWVADPQSAKPGNRMPVIGLEAGELHALVAYLETLK